MDFRTNDLIRSERNFRSKHGTTATMNTAGIGKPAETAPRREANRVREVYARSSGRP